MPKLQNVRQPFHKALLLVVLCIAPLVGCGGGGGGGAGLSPLQTIINPRVVVLPSDGSVTVASSDATSVTLSGNLPAFIPGSVVINKATPPFFRVVQSVSSDSGSTRLTTINATVEDVLQQGSIQYTHQVDFSTVKFKALQPGVGQPIVRSIKAPGRDIVQLSQITIPIHDLKISGTKSGEGFDTTVAATVNGSVTLSLAIDIALQANLVHGLELIRVAPIVKAQSDIKISVNGFEFSKVYGSLEIPDIPIPGTPLEMNLELTLSAAGGFETTGPNGSKGLDLDIHMDQTAKAGAQWSSQNGIEAIGDISPLNFQFTPRLHAPEGLTASISLARFDAFFKFYGIVGPQFEFNLPQLLWTVSRETSNSGSGTRFISEANFDVQGSLHAEFWHRNLLDVALPPFTLAKRSLANQFFPDNGQINVGIN